MPADVQGGSSAQRRLCKEHAQNALRALGGDVQLVITITPAALDPTRTALASATEDGVNVWTELFEQPRGAPRSLKDKYAGFVLYEEIAHYVLGSIGVPHGERGAGVFFQELFATWFQANEFVVTGHIPVTTYGLNDREEPLGHDVGKYAGYALAGYEPAHRQLQEWMESASADQRQVKLARAALAELVPPLTPAAVLDAYRRVT